MRVLKYKLAIKIDDFTTYAPGTWTEISEESLGKHYEYVARRIKDDSNMSWVEVNRTDDYVLGTSNPNGLK